MPRYYAIPLDAVARDDGRHILYVPEPGLPTATRPYLITSSQQEAADRRAIWIRGARTLDEAKQRAGAVIRAGR